MECCGEPEPARVPTAGGGGKHVRSLLMKNEQKTFCTMCQLISPFALPITCAGPAKTCHHGLWCPEQIYTTPRTIDNVPKRAVPTDATPTALSSPRLPDAPTNMPIHADRPPNKCGHHLSGQSPPGTRAPQDQQPKTSGPHVHSLGGRPLHLRQLLGAFLPSRCPWRRRRGTHRLIWRGANAVAGDELWR